MDSSQVEGRVSLSCCGVNEVIDSDFVDEEEGSGVDLGVA